MSTGVDGLSILVVNTVSKMSTKVDLSIIVLAYQVETVSGMSTEVDNVFLRQSFLLKL